MPERPTDIPADAVWDGVDDEWVLAELDHDGRKHGLATYWRPDGTIVNHCTYEHGVPHGWFKRYHESGEVSRAGTFVDGRIHGTDVCYRSAAPTTELAFPADQLPETVWRYEVDWVHGQVTTARWYDREGNQVTETGEAYPERPATVPALAVYLSGSATWLDGRTDDEGRHHGLWRSWSRDGIPTGEREMAHGNEVAARRFACAEDAEAITALREGRPADAVAAARLWWRRAERGSAGDRVLARELFARCLGESGAADALDERRGLYLAVADEPSVMWGVFTDEGRRCYQAQAAALDWLARDALAAGRAEDAVRLCDRAIETEHHYGPCAARMTKVAALRRSGRDDEAFQIAREILAADPDTAGLEDMRADPGFAAWLDSIRTDGMTAEGAWDVLGERGEKLASIAARYTAAQMALRDADEEDDEEEDYLNDEDEPADDLDATWPIREALAERISPELDRWIDVASTLPRQLPYGGYIKTAATPTVSAAVAAQDGKWLARLEGLFLPVSVVLTEDEQITHAAWAADPRGTSRVYRTHQDEPGFWPAHRSLAAFLAAQTIEISQYRPNVLPGAVRERWTRADHLLDEEPEPTPEPHLSVQDLYPRTGWIVRHLLKISGEYDLADAPGIETWAAEREQATGWPHLQAYWLLHHLVFDNREDLVFLVEHAERRHPAVAELAALAEVALGGGEVSAPWWDATAVHGIRIEAIDKGHTGLMSAAAQSRLRAGLSTRDVAAAEAAAARAALLASGDATAAEVFEMWDLLESAAGSLEACEEALMNKLIPEDNRMSYMLRQHTGQTSILFTFMVRLTEMAGPAYLSFFDAVVRRGIGYDEGHGCAVPGAIAGLGAAMAEFAPFRSRVEELLGAGGLGRRRRAELAIVAAQRFPQHAAGEYLIGEATRYARLLADGDNWIYDTAGYALHRLLDLEPATGGRILSDALAAAHFSGANWTSSTLLLKRAAELRIAEAAPGILAAVDRGLGRADDGDRAVVVVSYATCAIAGGGADEAVAALESRLGAADGVRADCERCALLAGLITAAPTDIRWHEQARAAIDALLADAMDSMQSGAAISLLKAIHAAGVFGFGDLVTRVRNRVAKDSDTAKPLLTWLADQSR
jgi:hypothetical protein